MYTILMRRGTAAGWTLRNPVLGLGEPGFERDTGKFKVGDGVRLWTELPYFVPATATVTPSTPTPPSSNPGGIPPTESDLLYEHIISQTPHPVYDDGPSLVLLYENAKV